MAETNKQLIERGLVVDIDDDVKDWLIEKYYKPAFGARPMRRAVQKEIEDRLSEVILEGRFSEGTRLKVTLKDGTPHFEEAESPVVAGMN